MLNIIGKRYTFFLISLLVIIPGLVLLGMGKLTMAIDFVGGTMLEVQFSSGQLVSPAEIIDLYNDLGYTDIQVQSAENNAFIIRSEVLQDEDRLQIVDLMSEQFESEIVVNRFDSVGPSIGKEVTSRGALAVAVAALGVVLYIFFAFRGVPHSFRYGVCAIIATIHDVLLLFSIAAFGGIFFGWQIDSYFLTALLTVIGFSTQDTIVVFDRMRENSNIYRRLPFETLMNHSVVQTLQRSINTQLMTSEFLLLSMALFGGVTLREFSLVLLIGLASGTYSSIFIAAPVLVVWENQEWKNWFRRSSNSMAA